MNKESLKDFLHNNLRKNLSEIDKDFQEAFGDEKRELREGGGDGRGGGGGGMIITNKTKHIFNTFYNISDTDVIRRNDGVWLEADLGFDDAQQPNEEEEEAINFTIINLVSGIFIFIYLVAGIFCCHCIWSRMNRTARESFESEKTLSARRKRKRKGRKGGGSGGEKTKKAARRDSGCFEDKGIVNEGPGQGDCPGAEEGGSTENEIRTERKNGEKGEFDEVEEDKTLRCSSEKENADVNGLKKECEDLEGEAGGGGGGDGDGGKPRNKGDTRVRVTFDCESSEEDCEDDNTEEENEFLSQRCC